ncbi:tRNA N(3)-methylcytidine methyltransferase METTL6 isoform X2 [Pseudoliparis swirei]|uniref:tRNA N(3)-methylcytidine methyltransferase METTL6 isoform X2 n=1 Tax=Pseudoliparis swirei TaxID=2059687 RepID=UPI0024BEB313|nr:tRNA N(3)-methylcytidine methyltransferase METTL6 isoform X2 [Pseudoliparis swirei]
MALSKNESFEADIKTTLSEEKEEEEEEEAAAAAAAGSTGGTCPRVVSREERPLLSDFKLMKLEKDAQKNWDLFYKRNTTNFFKDRHWTGREFEELKAHRELRSRPLVLLEAGCGVGNCLFPLLERDPHLFVYACDFSPRAVEFVKVLRPGGVVLFRDYGLNDYAMQRFRARSKLGENLYVRQDGTRAYFFSKELLAELFSAAGLQAVANDYVLRETVNKKEGLSAARVFLQSKFTKPLGQSESS